MNAAIALSGASKRYEGFALCDVDLELPVGEVMGLVGVNGAGKSTLLRLLMGLVRADGGSIEVLGHPMPQAQVSAKRDIGYASDDMRLYRGQTLHWHMDFIRSIYSGWDEPYAQQLAKRFDLRAEQRLGGFSHGQRVKALLLLILARHPRLLLLDEPTTGLDPVARGEVLAALADVLRDEQRSILFSSHNTADVEQISDSITFLHRGRILASRDKESFIDSWRRIVCRGGWNDDLRRIPGVISVQHSAPMMEFKIRGYDESTIAAMQERGLAIDSVQPMSLEDIFVTTVRGADTP